MTTLKPVPDIPEETFRLDPVEQAIRDIAAGRPIVVVDDEDRENEETSSSPPRRPPPRSSPS